jgi:DivIVA domain-containing protein
MDPRYQVLIDRIRNAQFRTTRLSPGYDEREVDDLLDRIVGILGASTRPDPDELSNARFSTTRLRPGYVQQDVDYLLAEIGQAVRAL